MRRVVVLTLAVLASSGLLAAGASAAATLAHEDGRILAFAHDGGRIAWLTDQCTTVRFQSIPTGQRATVHSRPVGFHRCDSIHERMAMAGKRVIFTTFLGGGNTTSTELRTASVALGRMRTLKRVWDQPGSDLGQFTGLAGDASTLAYSWVEMFQIDDDCGLNPGPCHWQAQGGEVPLVLGHRQRPLPLPRAAALAVSLGRAAVAPVSTAEQPDDRVARAVEDGPVEVRNARSGALITSFSPGGTVEKLAFSTTRVASLARLAGGGRRVEVHSATTGALQRSRVVSTLARELDMAGKLVVFRVVKAIRVLNVETGAVSTAALTKGRPIGISIEDHRIVWAENRNGEGFVRALVLP